MRGEVELKHLILEVRQIKNKVGTGVDMRITKLYHTRNLVSTDRHDETC
jgi:hypothetical protein